MSQTSGMGFKRSFGVGTKPVFQRDKAFLLAQGGFTLIKTTLAINSIIASGTPGVYDEAARTFAPLTVGKIHANAANNAVAYQIEKGSAFKVGDYFSVNAGAAAYAITAIDTSNAAYDLVTVGTTLGEAVTAGEFAFASTATGATASALPACNGLLYEDSLIVEGILQACSVVIRATVYARRVPYSAEIEALPGLKHIIYSQSF
jgi:hypothetical protein